MYISRFQVWNYKSFLDSNEVEFKRGFNIITGQNSAGKTALLEALAMSFEPVPHLNEITVPFRGAPPSPNSRARISLAISGVELVDLVRSDPGAYVFPRPRLNPPEPIALGFNGDQYTMDGVLQRVADLPELTVSVVLEKSVSGPHTWTTEGMIFAGLYVMDRHPQNDQVLATPVGVDSNGRLCTRGGPQYIPRNQDIRIWLAMQLTHRIYRFWAERFAIGESAFGASPVLAPNARNLPEVLNVLDGNTARFQRLNELVREVLPQVRHISVRPIGSNQVQIIVWPLNYATEKDYLAIPLNQCGSGVAQVLAILYVVLVSEHSQTIIVDEPQSFLHPGAVRKLIEVLKRFPKHQYIFATHSPTVITASDPATIAMVHTEGGSSLRSINPTDSKDLQGYLSEIGARLSDVFGADSILWVEGQTEEECFPLILRKIAHRSLMGIAIVGIRETSALQNRDKKKVFEMYRKLSQARTLLPPAIGFVLDEECLTDQQKDDLRRMDPGHVHFLPRRMYENYLLHPAAVASVMNGIDGFRQTPVTEDEVRQFFNTKRDERDQGAQQLCYFCRGAVHVPADWECRIDAAGLLTDAFQQLSETRVSYEKTTHSVAITEWLIENQPAELQEITAFVAQLLPH
jgi:predicted ATPase